MRWRHAVSLLCCELILALFSRTEARGRYLRAIRLHYKICADPAIDRIVRLDNIP